MSKKPSGWQLLDGLLCVFLPTLPLSILLIVLSIIFWSYILF